MENASIDVPMLGTRMGSSVTTRLAKVCIASKHIDLERKTKLTKILLALRLGQIELDELE